MYYLYILISTKSGKYYIGHSEDPFQRLIAHNESGRYTYTSKYRPWKLVAVYSVSTDKAEALFIERFVKNQKSKELVEKMITEDFVPSGVLAQLVRVPHLRD